MIFYLIICFILTCNSQCFVESTVDDITTVMYDNTSSVCTDLLTCSLAGTIYSCFALSATITNSTELIFDVVNYECEENVHITFQDLNQSPNLEIVKIKPTIVEQIIIYTDTVNPVNYYVGCFEDSNCGTISNLDINVYSTHSCVYIENTSDMYTQIVYYNDNSLNSIGYYYLFIESLTTLMNENIVLWIDEDYYSYNYLKNLSGSFYLFTGVNVHFNSFIYKDFTKSSTTYYTDFIQSSVCTRKNTDRNVLFHQDHTPYINCSCWTKNNDTEMDQSTLFNYPDCNYNSSMFDLILPSLSSTYSLNDDLLEWYSIYFTTASQSIQINDGKTLIIDELDLNQDDISFNENVYVKYLTVTSPGASFDTINFDNINYDETEDCVYLFSYINTSTDLESFNLKVKINGDTNKVFIGNCSTDTPNICETDDNDGYTDTEYITNDTCSLQKFNESNVLSLYISDNSYTLTQNEYWNNLTVSSNLNIYGSSYQLNANICKFEDTTITIDCNLYCKTMNINSNTKLIVNGELLIDTIVVTNEINNLNENGIIESYGSIEITSIEIIETQPNCFELISSNDSLTQLSINSDYSTLLLSQNHLLRICPSLNTNHEVQCTTIGNAFEQQSFDTLHCPCNDENCIINVNTNSFLFNDIEFKGEVFIQQTTTLSINSINILTLNSNSVTLQSTSNQMNVNSIISDGIIYIKNDCDIYSSFIPTIYPYSNVYLLNTTVEIDILSINTGYVPIIITSNVNSIDINEITINDNSDYLSYGLFTIEQSSELLEILTTPTTSYSNPFVLMKQQSRKLNYVGDIHCDNQVITINPTETMCNDLNLYDHYCYYSLSSDGQYYQNDYTTIDYSCPCNKSNSNCIIELDKNEIITYEIDLPLTTLVVYQDVTINPNNYDFSIQTNNDLVVTINSINNNVIYVNDESSQFTLNIPLTGNLLLIGSLNKFSQSITKSVTTIQSLQVSTDYYCSTLLIQNENNKCLICDAISNEDGYCTNNVDIIDNCQLQNGFGCEICYEGYESNTTYCNECPSNCLRCYNSECINCDTNYYANSGECSVINDDSILIYDNNKTMKCNDGYYSNFIRCIQCGDNCISCDSSGCLTCKDSYILNEGSCKYIDEINGEEIVSNYGVIECENGYYLNNEQCKLCSTFDTNCDFCNINGCLSCTDGYALLNDGSCSNAIQSTINDSISISCYDSGSWYNGTECVECGNNCKNCVNGQCIECEEDYILIRSNTCIYGTDVMPDYCLDLTYRGTCKRCEDGYYVNNYNFCEQCPNECTSCYNSTYCFECIDNYVINYYNDCVDKSKALENCYHFIPGSVGGCAICNPGYYRLETSCFKCIDNCTTCHNDYECTICNDNYFVVTDLTDCISYDELSNCDNKTASGCSECSEGYYLNGQYCYSCESKTSNCESCNKRNGECSTCSNDYVMVEDQCIHYQLIDNCKESSDSKCISCSFWRTPTSNGDGCETQAVWWVIVLGISFIVFIIICIVGITTYFVNKYLNHRKLKEMEKEVTIFDIKMSNINFIPINNKDIVINKDELLFNDKQQEIRVDEETRDLMCVGNTSKHTIKVQFSVKDGCDKYEIRTNPQLITIPKGKAVEFEIFIKPLCTCKINDQIMLISVDLKKGKTITIPIKINTITIMTTRLDYDELEEDIKLGEGSFGIVYKGTFRGNQVAIKKMKDISDNPDSLEEFNKEVAMLDKFRNDYIVHFYGAVMIPNKICMVTEFAQYGSLQDLINKRKKKLIDDAMKMKIVLDCSKGIQYLHSNGILHRDIKPDNFLVLSLDNNDPVNAKLTDFGSSRNTNSLTQNMTFTSGIGSPAYMAPEILKQEKYRTAADIYSFSLTMYETMTWDDAYPKDKFKFPWNIAEFVTNGNRLEKTDGMNDELYDLINHCWKQDPKERFTIEDIIKELEDMI